MKRGGIFEIDGVAREIGDVGALLTFDSDESLRILEQVRPSPRDYCVLQIPESERTIEAGIIDSDFIVQPAQIEVEYRRLVSLDEISPGEMALLPQSEQRYVLIPNDIDDDAFDIIGQRIVAFFDFVEAARALVNAVGNQLPQPTYSPPPRLERLEFASPIVIDINVAVAIKDSISFAVLGGLLMAFNLRKRWYEGTILKRQGKILKQQGEQAEITAGDMNSEGLPSPRETRDERAAIEKTYESEKATFTESVVDALTDGVPGSAISKAEAIKIAEDQLIPAIEAMADAGVTGVAERRPPGVPKP